MTFKIRYETIVGVVIWKCSSIDFESRALKKVHYKEKFVIAKFVIKKYFLLEIALAIEGNFEKVRNKVFRYKEGSL